MLQYDSVCIATTKAKSGPAAYAKAHCVEFYSKVKFVINSSDSELDLVPQPQLQTISHELHIGADSLGSSLQVKLTGDNFELEMKKKDWQ